MIIRSCSRMQRRPPQGADERHDTIYGRECSFVTNWSDKIIELHRERRKGRSSSWPGSEIEIAFFHQQQMRPRTKRDGKEFLDKEI